MFVDILRPSMAQYGLFLALVALISEGCKRFWGVWIVWENRKIDTKPRNPRPLVMHSTCFLFLASKIDSVGGQKTKEKPAGTGAFDVWCLKQTPMPWWWFECHVCLMASSLLGSCSPAEEADWRKKKVKMDHYPTKQKMFQQLIPTKLSDVFLYLLLQKEPQKLLAKTLKYSQLTDSTDLIPLERLQMRKSIHRHSLKDEILMKGEPSLEEMIVFPWALMTIVFHLVKSGRRSKPLA